MPTGGPAPLRWRLAAELQGSDPAAAREVLESLAADPDAGLLAEKAWLRLGGSPSGSLPAVVAPSAPGQASAPDPLPRPPVALAPGATATTLASPPDFGDWEPEPASETVAPPRASLVVEECTVDRLDEGGLVIRGADGAADLLLYSQVEAVAVAGISAAPKPYLLVDLVLSPGPGGTRTVLRLASTRLDPRQLIGMPTLPPMQAFRELVERLVVASGARLLPAPEAHTRIAMFSDPDAYQRAVLAEFQ